MEINSFPKQYGIEQLLGQDSNLELCGVRLYSLSSNQPTFECLIFGLSLFIFLS